MDQMMIGESPPGRVNCRYCHRLLAVVASGVTVEVACNCAALPIGGKTQRIGSVPGQAVAAAAERILAGKPNAQHALILRHLLMSEPRGLTQPEIALCKGVDSRAHRTRRLELTEAGLVRASGARRRLTYRDEKDQLVHGKAAAIYVLTERGRDTAKWLPEGARSG